MANCAGCGAALGASSLFSDAGDPICDACNARAELEGGEVRASRAILASSGTALGLAILAVAFDPCFVTTVLAVLSGSTTMALLHRHPEHRARLGRKAHVATAVAMTGILLSLVAPFAGDALRLWVFMRRREMLTAPTSTVASAPEEVEAPPDPRREIFDTLLPEWVAALDARSVGRERAAPRDVATTHQRVIGAVDAAFPSLHDAFATFLDDSERFATGSNDADDAALTNRLVLLDAALADARQPYYVDALLLVGRDRRRVLASSYEIARTRRYRSGELTITSLDLDRIDTLSFERSLLGYTRPDVRNALVLVSRVEDFLVRQALPSIHSVDESVTVRGYDDESGIEWVTELESAVHEDLRREATALATERSVLDLSAAIVQRRTALDALEHAVDGIRIREPATRDFDLEQLRGLAGRAGAFVGEVRAAQERLDTPELREAFATLEEARLASISRHEVQHRLDYEADRLVRVPDALAEYTGRTEHDDRVNHIAERANAELSAYLSQIARDTQQPLTSLVHILQFAFNRDEWGTPESYAAIVLAEELARELGIAHADFVQSPDVHREPIARVYLALRTRTPGEITAAAARAWQALYGSELPTLELVTP